MRSITLSKLLFLYMYELNQIKLYEKCELTSTIFSSIIIQGKTKMSISFSNGTMSKNVEKCRFKTNGTLKWLNLIDQKISQISEFVIKVNMGHNLYQNKILIDID